MVFPFSVEPRLKRVLNKKDTPKHTRIPALEPGIEEKQDFDPWNFDTSTFFVGKTGKDPASLPLDRGRMLHLYNLSYVKFPRLKSFASLKPRRSGRSHPGLRGFTPETKAWRTRCGLEKTRRCHFIRFWLGLCLRFCLHWF